MLTPMVITMGMATYDKFTCGAGIALPLPPLLLLRITTMMVLMVGLVLGMCARVCVLCVRVCVCVYMYVCARVRVCLAGLFRHHK